LLSVVADEQRRLGRLMVALVLAAAVAVSPMVAPVRAAAFRAAAFPPPPATGATAAPPFYTMADGATAQAAAVPRDDDDGVAAQAAGIAAMNLESYVPPVAVGSVTAASTASAIAAAWAEDKADQEEVRPMARGRAAPRRRRSPSPPLPGQRRRAAGKRLLRGLRVTEVLCVLVLWSLLRSCGVHPSRVLCIVSIYRRARRTVLAVPQGFNLSTCT